MKAIGILAFAVLLAGCQVTRAPHDDIRSSCVAASNAHQLATKRALAGDIPITVFAEMDEAWDQIAYDCRMALTQSEYSANARAVHDFNEKYGRFASDEGQ